MPPHGYICMRVYRGTRRHAIQRQIRNGNVITVALSLSRARLHCAVCALYGYKRIGGNIRVRKRPFMDCSASNVHVGDSELLELSVSMGFENRDQSHFEGRDFFSGLDGYV